MSFLGSIQEKNMSSLGIKSGKDKAKIEQAEIAAALERDKMAAEERTQQRIREMYFRPARRRPMEPSTSTVQQASLYNTSSSQGM